MNLFLGSIPIAPRILLWFSGPSVAVVGAVSGYFRYHESVGYSYWLCLIWEVVVFRSLLSQLSQRVISLLLVGSGGCGAFSGYAAVSSCWSTFMLIGAASPFCIITSRRGSELVWVSVFFRLCVAGLFMVMVPVGNLFMVAHFSSRSLVFWVQVSRMELCWGFSSRAHLVCVFALLIPLIIWA